MPQSLYRWTFTIQEPGQDGQALPDPGDVRAWLKAVAADKWVFQKERGAGRGEAPGREHYQGRLKLRVRKTKTYILQSWVHAGGNAVELTLRPESTGGARGSFDYCMKEDSRILGPWADSPLPVKYTGADLAVMETPLRWQQELLDLVKRKPDDRTVYWVWSGPGNVGKSKLCKYMVWKKLATMVPVGKAHQLRANVCKRPAATAYLLDIPRTLGRDDSVNDFLSVVEAIKNGMVEDCMYGAANCLMMVPPHVVCFSNMPPPRQMLSSDRWVVRELRSKHDSLDLGDETESDDDD